jgi:cytochrome c553
LAEPLAPKLNHQRESYIFFALLAYRDGERTDPVMTPWAQGLSDQDARDLAAALSGPMFDRPPVALVDDPAYPLAARECLWCHGETGIGEFEGMPVLAGQDAAYLARALTAYRDGSRTDPTMAGVAAGLSDDGIDRLAKYYAGHQWLERNR